MATKRYQHVFPSAVYCTGTLNCFDATPSIWAIGTFTTEMHISRCLAENLWCHSSYSFHVGLYHHHVSSLAVRWFACMQRTIIPLTMGVLAFRTMEQTVRSRAQHSRLSEHKTCNCSVITSTYDGFMTNNERTPGVTFRETLSQNGYGYINMYYLSTC